MVNYGENCLRIVCDKREREREFFQYYSNRWRGLEETYVNCVGFVPLPVTVSKQVPLFWNKACSLTITIHCTGNRKDPTVSSLLPKLVSFAEATLPHLSHPVQLIAGPPKHTSWTRRMAAIGYRRRASCNSTWTSF